MFSLEGFHYDLKISVITEIISSVLFLFAVDMGGWHEQISSEVTSPQSSNEAIATTGAAPSDYASGDSDSEGEEGVESNVAIETATSKY